MAETVLVLPPRPPTDPEWLAARREGIGASEIAAVLGISPYESPFSLYWRKVHGWQIEDAPQLEAGRRAEPMIADWFADTMDPHENLVVRPAGLYQHAERPWQLATPDRLVHMVCSGCDGAGGARWCDGPGGLCTDCLATGLGSPPVAVLEVKHPYSWDGYGETGSAEIPVHYRAQVLWQLDVLGVPEGYLAAYSRHEFRWFRIRRDERDLVVMRAAGQRFMDRLASGEPPDIDEHRATLAALKRLHPTVDPDAKPAEVHIDLAEGYRRARAAKARAEALVDRYEARIRTAIGGGQKALCNGRLVASRSVYDRKPYEVGPSTIDKLNPGRSASYAPEER